MSERHDKSLAVLVHEKNRYIDFQLEKMIKEVTENGKKPYDDAIL
jgi:hypothetical protein